MRDMATRTLFVLGVTFLILAIGGIAGAQDRGEVVRLVDILEQDSEIRLPPV